MKQKLIAPKNPQIVNFKPQKIICTSLSLELWIPPPPPPPPFYIDIKTKYSLCWRVEKKRKGIDIN